MSVLCKRFRIGTMVAAVPQLHESNQRRSRWSKQKHPVRTGHLSLFPLLVDSMDGKESPGHRFWRSQRSNGSFVDGGFVDSFETSGLFSTCSDCSGSITSKNRDGHREASRACQTEIRTQSETQDGEQTVRDSCSFNHCDLIAFEWRA